MNKEQCRSNIGCNDSVFKNSLAAFKIAVEIDHESKPTAFAVGTFVAPIEVPIELLPNVVAVETEAFVEVCPDG